MLLRANYVNRFALGTSQLSKKYISGFSLANFQKQNVTVTAENPAEKSYELHKERTQFNDEIKSKFQSAPKLPTRLPLMKNFFCGKVDTELLAYPEVINREDMAELQSNIDGIKSYFKDNVNSDEIVSNKQIPASVLGDFQKLNFFGSNVSHNLGGRGNNSATESCLISEAETEDINIATILNVHRLVVQIIEENGTEAQKLRYLPELAKGNLIGSVAFYESEIPPTGFFNTKANCSDGDSWTLNGEKTYVTNAKNANLFIVMAQTSTLDTLGDRKDTVTAFILDRSMPGIQVSEEIDKTIGCLGAGQSKIKFDKVEVPNDNILGTIGDGTAIAQKMTRLSRLQSGVVSLSLMKKIINHLTDYCLNTNQLGIKLMDMELLREKLSKAICAAYALESMIYLTTGMIDAYEDQDVEMETAIIRIFSQQNLLQIATLALDFMGPKTLIDGQPIRLYLGDTLQMYTHGEIIDSLKLFVGLAGLQHCGQSIHEEVKKVRNPLMNPSFIFKKLFDKNSIESPKSSLQLNHYLHPSLDPAAQWLEYSIIRLQIGSEALLSRHGLQVMDKHNEIMRLSESAILTYAIFASVSRASRSYCIGLQHSDFEMLMSSTYAFDAMKVIKRLIIDISEGPYLSNDTNYQKIATQIFKKKGYFSAHPLTRNF